MKRRILGIVVAVVLGLAGTTALVLYVQDAREDAAEAEPTSTVLVVSEPVRQGTGLTELANSVEPVEVPTRLVAEGALDDLEGVPGELVTGVELRPGEQLLRSRLVEPSTLVRVDVPDGLQEVTIALDPERAVGGTLRPGDTVGIVLSFDPFEVEASAAQPVPDPLEPVDPTATTTTVVGPRRTPNTTNLTLQQVLVTSVQYSRADVERASEIRNVDEDAEDQVAIDPTIAESPRDQLLVTVAVTGPEAEQIVFAAEFGRIWLTGQDPDTDLDRLPHPDPRGDIRGGPELMDAPAACRRC
jgi:pilus assembly protein CpaB